MTAGITLDCRDGVHEACETCDCWCHRPAEVPASEQVLNALLGPGFLAVAIAGGICLVAVFGRILVQLVTGS